MTAAERLASPLLAALNALVPKRSRKVVVHSLPDFEDGALAVLEELQRRGIVPIVLLEDPASIGSVATYVEAPVRAFAKNSMRGRFHFLTAGHVITTHGVFRPHRRPKGQTVVNIWHGEPLVKPVGRWIGQEPAVQSDWATALSNLGKAFRCAELSLDPSQVLVVGSPRNDRLLRADAPTARRALTAATGARHVFLWLPTYRAHGRGLRVDGTPHDGPVPLQPGEMAVLDEWLAENDAVMVAKPHPLSPRPGGAAHARIELIDSDWLTKAGLTLYEVLAAADCLVTDVSSVWLDYLLVDRPMVFAMPDLEEYRKTRGLHLEPYEKWVPGPVATDGDELIEALAAVVAGDDRYGPARAEALSRFHRFHDAHSTKRLLDAVSGLS